jgi:hypothetical protein
MRAERLLANGRWQCYACPYPRGSQRIGPRRVSPIQKVRAMPQISPPHTIAQLASPLIPSPSLSLFVLLVSLSVWPAVTLAEVRVVTAQGEHRMGDRDTREDSIRLATEHHNRRRSRCDERRNSNLYRWLSPCPGARDQHDARWGHHRCQHESGSPDRYGRSATGHRGLAGERGRPASTRRAATGK